jgi:hypothetical protein
MDFAIPISRESQQILNWCCPENNTGHGLGIVRVRVRCDSVHTVGVWCHEVNDNALPTIGQKGSEYSLYFVYPIQRVSDKVSIARCRKSIKVLTVGEGYLGLQNIQKWWVWPHVELIDGELGYCGHCHRNDDSSDRETHIYVVNVYGPTDSGDGWQLSPSMPDCPHL